MSPICWATRKAAARGASETTRDQGLRRLRTPSFARSSPSWTCRASMTTARTRSHARQPDGRTDGGEPLLREGLDRSLQCLANAAQHTPAVGRIFVHLGYLNLTIRSLPLPSFVRAAGHPVNGACGLFALELGVPVGLRVVGEPHLHRQPCGDAALSPTVGAAQPPPRDPRPLRRGQAAKPERFFDAAGPDEPLDR